MNNYDITAEVIRQYLKENDGIDNFSMMRFTEWLASKITKK